MTKNKIYNTMFYLTKVIFIFLLFCFKSYSSDFLSIGDKNAPVKLEVFSSLTCPHCANFHKNIIPEIKKEFADQGKVQIIFIDFPLDQAALNASKIVNCVDKNLQIKFLDIIYEKQNEWTSASNIEEINENLKKLALELGINTSQFNNCLNNEEIENKILNARIEGQKKYSINSTPTIIINDKKFDGEQNLKNIKKMIEKLI